MSMRSIAQVLESDKVVAAAAADGFTNCLVRVVGALDAALMETANENAAGQLSRFARILCVRCGGNACGSNCEARLAMPQSAQCQLAVRSTGCQ